MRELTRDALAEESSPTVQWPHAAAGLLVPIGPAPLTRRRPPH